MAKYRHKISVQKHYTQPATTPTGFNAVLFINRGRTACTVAGIPLAQNERLGWSHHEGEVDASQYRIDFPSGYPANCDVYAIFLVYDDQPLIGE